MEAFEQRRQPTPETTRRDLPFRGVPSINFNKDKGGLSAKEKEKRGNHSGDKNEPAYRHISSLDDENRVGTLTDKILTQPITIETSDLLGLSPQLRKELTKALAKKRVASRDEAEEPELVDQDMIDTIDIDTFPPVGVEVLKFAIGPTPAGARILGDPVMQYLGSLPEGEEPKKIFVAKESQSLRTIFPLINGIDHVESVLDGGSQIVSMSEETAKHLKLTWDPDITIHMQSANGQVEKTLGLARNVSFVTGDIVTLLQVHIIRGPAYKVLIGRPFDTHTRSIITNTPDGGQTITITDPNTGIRAVIPTHQRGAKHLIGKPKPDFQASRI